MHPHSIKAYREAHDALQGRKRDVFNCLALCFRDGATDREVMTKLGFQEPNAIRPRITELIGEGLADEVGSTKCPVTGRTVRVVKAITECQPNLAQQQLL